MKYCLAASFVVIFAIFSGCSQSKINLTNETGTREAKSIRTASMPDDDFEPEPYRVIFTPVMTLNNKPARDVKDISIKEKQIYIHVMWLLPVKEHEAMVKMYDGAGHQVHLTRHKFIPPTKSWNMTAAHLINRDIEAPGEWRFEVYMDGKLRIAKTLMVTPD